MSTHNYSRPESSPAMLVNTGQILANIPGILGFYPHESLLIVCTHKTEPGSYFLGAILRIDLHDRQTIEEASKALDLIDSPDLVFLFVVSETQQHEEEFAVIEEAIQLSYENISTHGCPVAGAWQCEQILTGESYRLLGRHGCDVPSNCRNGFIPPITDAVAMAPWRDAGRLPEVSRAAAIDQFGQENPFLDDVEIEEIFDESYFLSTYPESLASAVAELRWLICEINDRRLDLDHILGDIDGLSCLATTLISVDGRDAMIETILDEPIAAEAAMLAAAKTFSGVIRANALSLLALARIQQNFTMEADLALALAMQEVPEHRLSRLLHAAIRTAKIDSVIDGVRRGSREAMERLEAIVEDFDDDPDLDLGDPMTDAS